MSAVTRSLFAPVVPLEQTHPLFRQVLKGPGHAAARRLMDEIFADFHDVDKSFVKKFQTDGFSPRVFELALFAYLREQDYDLDRSHPAPDFVIHGEMPVAIEATTTNPPQSDELDDIAPSPPGYRLVPDDLPAADRAFVFQIGKALRRKLLKRDAAGHAYWEQSHVAGAPFVIAVAAFHNQHAQWHTMGFVAEYLYGRRAVIEHAAAGKLRISAEEITEHELAGKTIPSGLFGHPEAANLAGVLFSNTHTISIFNRIGTERGYGSPDVAMCRIGTTYDPDANASEPLPFGYVVGDRPPGEQETFAEGLHLFLNPWAVNKLSPEALRKITFSELLDDGRVLTTSTGGLEPFVSKTFIFEGQGADVVARYHQLQYLGLIPPRR